MMQKSACLTLTFTGLWLAGTGAGLGRDGDVRAHRDVEGFPAMPMSQVKGTLREAARRLADAGLAGWDDAAVKVIFGGESRPPQGVQPAVDATAGGIVFAGEARLSADDATAAQGRQDRLFRRVASTAVNTQGVAEDRSLRTVEACVPLTLYATLTARATVPLDWVALLDAAAASMLSLGKIKNDGFGRVIASVTPDPCKADQT
jgi:hypothetical protein